MDCCSAARILFHVEPHANPWFHVKRSRKIRHPMQFPADFDVIVVGGGHAGTEAALAAARMGAQHAAADAEHRDAGPDELQPGHRRHRQGPSGAGRSTRSVAPWPAPRIAAGIQFRTLNVSKGPAVRATRAQADRRPLSAGHPAPLENQPNLTLFQQEVADLIVEGDRVAGVVTQARHRVSTRTPWC